MERDPNDYGDIQEKWEGADEAARANEDWLEHQAERDADLDMQDEIRAANRYGVFDLRYSAVCDRCGKAIPVGTRVVGRKIDGTWVIEEPACVK
jgi:hypothetical protein